MRRPKKVAALSEGGQQCRNFRARRFWQLLDERSRGPVAAWRLVERQLPRHRLY
jgi:hypothetical protein